MKKIICSLLFIILFVCAFQAQTTESLTWTRIESDTKDFSVAVPSNYQVLQDEKGYEAYYGSINNARKIKLSNIRYITAFENGATFLVESYKVVNLTDSLASLNSGTMENPQAAGFKFEKFNGTLLKRENADSYSIELIIGSEDRAYRIFAAARDKNNETLARFLASLKLNDKSPIKLNLPDKSQISETIVAISNLKETDIVIEKEKKGESENTGLGNKSKNPQTENASKKFLVLYKPRPAFTQAARNSRTEGNVSLRVIFAGNGNIEKITIISGLSNGLTGSAVKAARLMRFLPLEIDNQPTSTIKQVVFSFSIY